MPYDDDDKFIQDLQDLVRGIEFIRQREMRHRDDLSNIVKVILRPGEPNVEAICSNGNRFLLSFAYIEDYFDEARFNKAFGI